MPYAQQHYPFENKQYFERNFPADFVAEGLDQTWLVLYVDGISTGYLIVQHSKISFAWSCFSIRWKKNVQVVEELS